MNNSATSFVSAVALALAVALGSGAPARAELNVDITRGFVEPLPVAITDFYAETLEESKTGKDLAGVISADLERSGLFRPIDQGAFIQDAASLRKGPRFSDWRLINAQALIQGSVEMQPDGRLRVSR
jgi:TolB protein